MDDNITVSAFCPYGFSKKQHKTREDINKEKQKIFDDIEDSQLGIKDDKIILDREFFEQLKKEHITT